MPSPARAALEAERQTDSRTSERLKRQSPDLLLPDEHVSDLPHRHVRNNASVLAQSHGAKTLFWQVPCRQARCQLVLIGRRLLGLATPSLRLSLFSTLASP